MADKIKIVTDARVFGGQGKAPEMIKERGWEVVYVTGRDELHAALPDADILIGGLGTFGRTELELGKKLRAVVKNAVGFDNVDLEAATELGLPVTNAPGSNTNAVAEMTVCAIISMLRTFVENCNAMSDGKWHRPVGFEIKGRTIGILGIGNIGRSVAEKVRALGMKVIAHDPYPNMDFVKAHDIELYSMDEVLQRSEIVTLHMPGGVGTFIDAGKIALMKKGSWLINYARGEVLDLDALEAAIQSGHLAGAAIDAYMKEPPDFSHPVFKNPKVLATGHVAAFSYEALEAMTMASIRSVDEILAGKMPTNLVNKEVKPRWMTTQA